MNPIVTTCSELLFIEPWSHIPREPTYAVQDKSLGFVSTSTFKL